MGTSCTKFLLKRHKVYKQTEVEKYYIQHRREAQSANLALQDVSEGEINDLMQQIYDRAESRKKNKKVNLSFNPNERLSSPRQKATSVLGAIEILVTARSKA